jgi:hypothetical protein
MFGQMEKSVSPQKQLVVLVWKIRWSKFLLLLWKIYTSW